MHYSILQKLWPGGREDGNPAMTIAEIVSRCLVPQDMRAKAGEMSAELKVTIYSIFCVKFLCALGLLQRDMFVIIYVTLASSVPLYL